METIFHLRSLNTRMELQKMYILRFATMILLGLFFQACCPSASLHPLSDPSQTTYDDRLDGAWKVISEDEIGYFHVGKGENGMTQVVVIDHKSNGELEFFTFLVFPTHIEEKNYMNINLNEIEKDICPDTAYYFMKYEIIDNKILKIYHPDDKPLINAVLEGKLKGNIKYSTTAMLEEAVKEIKDQDTNKINETSSEWKNNKDNISGVFLTDETNNLVKFFKEFDTTELFPEAIELKRLK